MTTIDKKAMAAMIDHTILKPGATGEQVVQLCREARENGFASVCVNPCFVSLVSKQLEGSSAKTCSVIGFPLGANTTEVKALEAQRAVADGAHEIDMVIHVGALKAGDLDYVEKDIAAVVKASGQSAVKVIIETCLLTDAEKETACRLAKKAGAAFVKTSTGFSTGGATAADVALMRGIVGDSMGVKASGGVKSLQDALIMVEAGASRIGTSSGIAIVGEL